VITGFLFYGVNEEIIMIFIFSETHKPEALKNCFIKVVAYFSGKTNGCQGIRTLNYSNMTKLILLLIFFPAIVFSQAKVDTLKNETIIKLTKSKLPESVITQKINQSFCNFDVSVDALIKLKENNVTDSVINLMIRKQSRIDAITSTSVKNNINDKNYAFTESGIYFLANGIYTNLDPTIVSATSPKSVFFGVK
jgi:hypothetical protein